MKHTTSPSGDLPARTATSEQLSADIGALAVLPQAHYRAAERICAQAQWPNEVCNAAAVVGAEKVPYLTLVQRAREVLLRGAVYTGLRNGRYVVFGASLIDEGGFVALRSETCGGTP